MTLAEFRQRLAELLAETIDLDLAEVINELAIQTAILRRELEDAVVGGTVNLCCGDQDP